MCVSTYTFEQISSLSEEKKINQIITNIQITKPHLNIISVTFVTQNIYFYDNYYDEEYVEMGIQVFDCQKMIHKFLKVEYIKESIAKLGVNRDLIDKYSYYYNTQDLPELQTIKQIQNAQYTLLYDIFFIQLSENQYCIVYETEQLDLPYEYFLENIDQESKFILTQYMNELKHYISLLYEKQFDLNDQQNYFIKLTDEGIIQIKSFFNVYSCIPNQKKEVYPDQCIISSKKCFDRIFNNNEIILNQQLKKQSSELKQDKRIQKQYLSVAMDMIRPQIAEYGYHSKEIIQIIQQHPKYDLFSLIRYDKDCIVFKIYNTSQKYLLKLQKFNSLNEAIQRKQQFDSLRQFQQENQELFLDIGECKIICVESHWYVQLEECFILKQKNHKLIDFQQAERIQQQFQQMNIPSLYIIIFQIIKYLNHFEKICKLGFKSDELHFCQPYIYISDENKISSSKIIFSSPYFLVNRFDPDKYLKSEPISDQNLVDTFMNNLNDYFNQQDKNNFTNTLDDLQNPFSKLDFNIKQTEKLIYAKEQFPNYEIYLNKNFKVILILKIDDNFKENKDTLNQIVQFKFEKFICSFEQLQICKKYLTKENNIQYLEIKESSNEKQNSLKQKEKINDDICEQLQNLNLNSIFQKVKKLTIKQNLNFKDMQINEQQFPSLQDIKIRIDRNKQNFIERMNELSNILQIFDDIKQFKTINIDIKQFQEKEYEIHQFYKDQGNNKTHSDKEQEISLITEQINSLFLSHNIQNVEEIENDLYNDIQKIISKFNYIQVKCSIWIVDNNESEDYILLFQFNDTSIFNLGELDLYFKLNFQYGKTQSDKPLQIQYIQSRNQSRLICKCPQYTYYSLLNYIYDWILCEIEANLMSKVFDTIQECKCFDYDQITMRIYKGQKQIKSMNLYFCENYCQAYSINPFCDQVGLSQGDQFTALQELCLEFEAKFNNYDKILKDLFKVINKNKSINTIKFQKFKIPKFMFKLHRIVKLVP